MSDETTGTPRKLSYDPAKLPNPMGPTEHYSYAMLIEMRALRSVVARLADAIEASNTPVEQPKAAKTK